LWKLLKNLAIKFRLWKSEADMALPASGAITLDNVNAELFVASGTTIQLDQQNLRNLFVKPTPQSQIDMDSGHGKSNRVIVNITIPNGTLNFNIFNNRGAQYIAGITDVTVTINSGSAIGASSTGEIGLDTGTGWTAGDTISIINNGYIVGAGGIGAAGTSGVAGNAGAGGTAFIVRFPVKLTNNNIIGGGGGGGGAGGAYYSKTWLAGAGGGGGAGFNAGAGGTSSGATNYSTVYWGSAGTLTAGGVGGTGSAGGGGAGGAGGNLGASGASGVSRTNAASSGAAGGNAINGNANITWVAVGTIYGAIT
jgi:hypothetical protein